MKSPGPKRGRLGWRAAVHAVASLYSKSLVVCFVGDLNAAMAEWARAHRAILEAEQAIERTSWTWSPKLSVALDQAIAAREALSLSPWLEAV